MEGLPSKEEMQKICEEISVATENLNIAESAWESSKHSRDQAWESYRRSKLKGDGGKDQEELQHLKDLWGDSVKKLAWASVKVTAAAGQLEAANDKLQRANKIANFNVDHQKKKLTGLFCILTLLHH